MNRLKPDDALYFHHIPKTGGWSLHEVLIHQFPPEQVSPARLLDELARIPPDDLAHQRLFSGHFFYYINQLLPQPPLTITMLRDPVERTISQYRYLRKVFPNARLGTLAEFIRNPTLQPWVENLQTRILALDLDADVVADLQRDPKTVFWRQPWPEGLSDDERLARAQAGWRVTKPDMWSDEELLPKAIERLDQFAFFGLTERFTESVLLLCHTFGWPQPDAIPWLNAAPTVSSRDQIDPDLLREIEQRTSLDRSLYDHAKMLFERRLTELIVSLTQANSQLENQVAELEQWRLEREANVAAGVETQAQLDWQRAEIARLAQIENSWIWQFMLRIHGWRATSMPDNSRLGQLYHRIRGS